MIFGEAQDASPFEFMYLILEVLDSSLPWRQIISPPLGEDYGLTFGGVDGDAIGHSLNYKGQAHCDRIVQSP